MKTRIISGALMLPLLGFVWVGGVPLWAGCLLLALGGAYEFFKGLRAMGRKPSAPIGYLSIIALYALIYCYRFAGMVQNLGFWLGCWLFLTMAAAFAISLFREDHDVFDGPLAAMIALYIGFFSSHIVFTESLKGPVLWLIFISAFGTDTMAYFSGYFLGKHKLCPNLSPKKTIEGAVGGVLGSALLSFLFGLAFAPDHAVLYGISGLAASPFAQAGDLIASAFKRKMGIKDYGKLIPGHGGIMDRVDSVLLTAPVIYYIFSIISGF